MRCWGKQLLAVAAFFLTIPAFAQENPQDISQENLTTKIEAVASEQLNTAKELLTMIWEFIIQYSFQVLGGIIVLVLGWFAGNYLASLFQKFLTKRNVDITVMKFMTATVKFGVVAFAVIVALGKFGIEIAPLIAGISVAGFGLSFALQGPLSNYAAGATLIFTKPFKVGDIIEVADVVGEVMDLKMPRTEIKTVDGNMIVIPNKHIVGEIIHNYSDAKRLDLTFGVSYKSDIDKAIRVIIDTIKGDERVFSKEPKVGISEFADSSVNIMARLWCKQDDYWNVMFDVNKKVFDSFNKEGIEIPFPQRDVHLFKEE